MKYLIGIGGILLILLIAYAFSANRRTVGVCLVMRVPTRRLQSGIGNAIGYSRRRRFPHVLYHLGKSSIPSDTSNCARRAGDMKPLTVT